MFFLSQTQRHMRTDITWIGVLLQVIQNGWTARDDSSLHTHTDARTHIHTHTLMSHCKCWAWLNGAQVKCSQQFNDLLSSHSALFIVQQDNLISSEIGLRILYYQRLFVFYWLRSKSHEWDNVGRALLYTLRMDNEQSSSERRIWWIWFSGWQHPPKHYCIDNLNMY